MHSRTHLWLATAAIGLTACWTPAAPTCCGGPAGGNPSLALRHGTRERLGPAIVGLNRPLPLRDASVRRVVVLEQRDGTCYGCLPTAMDPLAG